MANLKRSKIELVTEVKEGEIITKVFYTPPFLPMSVMYEGLDVAEAIENGELSEREKLEKMAIFVADTLYKGQFTTEDIENGLHGPEAIEALQEQLVFSTNGYQSDETKNFLAKKN